MIINVKAVYYATRSCRQVFSYLSTNRLSNHYTSAYLPGKRTAKYYFKFLIHRAIRLFIILYNLLIL